MTPAMKKERILKDLLKSALDVENQFNDEKIKSDKFDIMDITDIDVNTERPYFSSLFYKNNGENYEKMLETFSLVSSERIESRNNEECKNDWANYTAKYILSYLASDWILTTIRVTVAMRLSTSYTEQELANIAYNAFRDTIKKTELRNAKLKPIVIPETLDEFDTSPVTLEFVAKNIYRHL